MTQKKAKRSLQENKELFEKEEDFLRPLISAVLQEILEAEMNEASNNFVQINFGLSSLVFGR